MKVKMTFAVLALTALALTLPASSTANRTGTDVVATGLHDPRGIDADDGDHGDRLLVAQSGSGEITEILTRKKGESTVRAFATVPPISSPNDVVAYGFRTALVTGGPPGPGGTAGQLLRVPRGGESSLIADIAAYQQGDPDPVDQEDNPTETNPFGIALPRKGILVVDAAGNDLLRIGKDGSIETVARFPTRTVPFPEGIPEGPPPGTPFEAESVPTAVAVGPDGAWYVSELLGFPFTKGKSRIWRIEPGTEDHNCDATATSGPCRVFADGFTSVIDLTFADDTLLVLEIVKEGLLAAEAGTAPPIGALWTYEDGSKNEIAPGALLAPGGVAVADEERIYVTTATFLGPGAGEVVRIKGALEDDDDGEQGDGRGHHGDDDHDDDDDHGDKRHKKDKKHKGGKHKKNKKHDRDDD
jgi:hypothetical protein